MIYVTRMMISLRPLVTVTFLWLLVLLSSSVAAGLTYSLVFSIVALPLKPTPPPPPPPPPSPAPSPRSPAEEEAVVVKAH